MARSKSLKATREAIGSALAYQIDWHALGFMQITRCGGTVELTDTEGQVYKIQVSEPTCNPT